MSKLVLDILQKKWWNPKKYRKTSSFSTCIVLDFRFPRVFLNPKKYNPAIRLSNTWWEAEVRCCSIFKSRINFMKYIYFLYWPYWYNVKWNFGRKKYSYLYFSKEFSTKDVKISLRNPGMYFFGFRRLICLSIILSNIGNKMRSVPMQHYMHFRDICGTWQSN